MLQDSPNTTRFAAGSEILSLPDGLPSSPMLPVTNLRARISPAENAINDAKEAMTTINLSKTWEDAIERVKWVMDTLSPVAEVRYNVLSCKSLAELLPQLHPYARMAYSLLFAIPKVTRLCYCGIEILMLCLFGYLDPSRTVST